MSELFCLRVQTNSGELTNELQRHLTLKFGNYRDQIKFLDHNDSLAIEINKKIENIEFAEFISYFLALELVKIYNLQFQQSIVPTKFKTSIEEFRLNLHLYDLP